MSVNSIAKNKYQRDFFTNKYEEMGLKYASLGKEWLGDKKYDFCLYKQTVAKDRFIDKPISEKQTGIFSLKNPTDFNTQH